MKMRYNSGSAVDSPPYLGLPKSYGPGLASPEGVTRVCIYSRGEAAQALMRSEFDDDFRLRWFIGDVRDRARLDNTLASAMLLEADLVAARPGVNLSHAHAPVALAMAVIAFLFAALQSA